MADNEEIQKEPVGRQEIVNSIAKTLRERRKDRNVTLKAASQTIKIRIPFLEAIERGDWQELPAEVYIRGFVLRYAQYLGMDGNALLEPYLNLVKRPSPVPIPPLEDPAKAEFRGMGWIWMGLVVMAFFGLLNFLKPERPIVESRPEVSTPSKQMATTPSETKNAAVIVSEPIALLTHKIDVYTIEPLWMRITTESQSFEGFIPQDATWTWKGEGEFDIRLGHTRNVQMSFDGTIIPLGEKQKRLILPNEG